MKYGLANSSQIMVYKFKTKHSLSSCILVFKLKIEHIYMLIVFSKQG